MDFTILGRTQLFVDERSIYLGATKQRALLALLLLTPGRPVRVEMIAQQLWEDRMRVQIRGNLHSMISRLRAALKYADEPCHLKIDGDAYRLDVDPQRIDYHRFRRQAELARVAMSQGEHAPARRLLIDAVELWRGVPLLDLQGDRAMRRREHMETSDLLPAYQSLIECELMLGEYATALSRLGQLRDDHPLDETLAAHWIQALDGLGRVGEVTAFAARYRQRMLTELGAEPSAVFQAALGGVLRRRTPSSPTARPPTSSPPARRPSVWRLRRGVADLVGRDDLLAELDSAFLGREVGLPAPVVALHGMPGVGKTSLALYWGQRRRLRFCGGLFLNLNGYGQGGPVTAEDAMAVFLGQLGMPSHEMPASGDQRAAELGRLLAGREVLMVLDNVRDSTQVRPLLLAAGSSCPVLLTSRGQLDGLTVFDDLRAIRVPPLSTVDSVGMLRTEVGRARADGDPTAVAVLAELSGGLPLVLKVIGQTAANKPRNRLVDIIRELGGRAGMVASTPATDDQAATVHGAFASSVSALPGNAASLFRALGVHPGAAFSNQLAAALLGGGIDDADQHLQILAKGNLLESDGLHRYRFHDLVHAFAGMAVARDEPPDRYLDVLVRVSGWYLGTATNAARLLEPSSEPPRPMTVDIGVPPLEFDTEDQAFDWCVQERENLIATTRRAAENGLHDFAWRIPAAVGEIFERTGHMDDFLDVLNIGVVSARKVGDSEAEICLLNFIGGNHFCRHRYREAQAHFRTALLLAEDVGHLGGQSVSRHNLAGAHMQLGEIEVAITIYCQTLQQDREMGDRGGEAWVLHQLGSAFRRLGQYETALRHYQGALAIRREIGAVRGQGETLTSIGALHYQRDDHEQAVDFFARALLVHGRSQDRMKTAQTLTILAGVHHDIRQFNEAVDHAERAVDLCRATEDRQGLARALHVLGHGLYEVGERDLAARRWADALALVEGVDAAQTSVLHADLGLLGGSPGGLTLCSSLREQVIQ